MSYKTLLAHVCIGRDNCNVHSVSARLAELFDAQLIGIAGARLFPPVSEVPVADMMQHEREAAENSLKNLEHDFRAAMHGRTIDLAWRASWGFEPVSSFVAREARAADLIIVSPESASVLERMDEPHLGPLVLQAGRPVLMVPVQQRELQLRKVVVAWKDTREARRAVADALPLLKKAQYVLVLEVCPQDDLEEAKKTTADVAHWLERHGVTAHPIVEACEGTTDVAGLQHVVREEDCDLIIAGAYGHTRLREWVFGGVTMDFLLAGQRCVLLSH